MFLKVEYLISMKFGLRNFFTKTQKQEPSNVGVEVNLFLQWSHPTHDIIANTALGKSWNFDS